MKNAIVAMCLMLALISCSSNDDEQLPIPTNNKKLVAIEFTNPNGTSPAMLKWDIIYNSAGKPTDITSSINGNIKLIYTGNNVTKVEYYLGVGNSLSSYHQLSYNNSGLLESSSLYSKDNIAQVMELYNTYKYIYAGSKLIKKESYAGTGGNNTVLEEYYEYSYGSAGNITEMKVYEPTGQYSGKFTYTSTSSVNKLKQLIPPIHVLGTWTEGTNWDYFDSPYHLENQYLNAHYVSNETFYQGSSLTYQTNYQFSFDSDGDIVQKSDSYGNVIKYYYQ